MIRRIASGVSLRDTAMLDDPLRRQIRAFAMGAVVTVMACAGAFVISLLQPAGVASTHTILVDRASGAMYVLVSGTAHPVLNLASARLITGRAVDPVMVKSSEIDKYPAGNLVGIPGAPQRMVQNPDRDASWTVCDGAAGPAAGVSVIAGALRADGASGQASSMKPDAGLLVSAGDGQVWLIWDGRRARLDVADTAVTAAIGAAGMQNPPPRPVAPALLNMIPESPPLRAPFIPNAGDPPRFPLADGLPRPPNGSLLCCPTGCSRSRPPCRP
jgi:type VII secretion protein EccB